MKINFLIDSGSAINIFNLATFQNLKKVNSKLHLKTTKTKIVPYGQSENCLKIEGVCYLTLEISSKFTSGKFYVANTKAKILLTGSCAIALNLLSINTETSKSYQKQKHQSKTSINTASCPGRETYSIFFERISSCRNKKLRGAGHNRGCYI